MVRSTSRVAEEDVAGLRRPLLSLADRQICSVSAVAVIWPLHSWQNVDNEMLSIAQICCESFRESGM